MNEEIHRPMTLDDLDEWFAEAEIDDPTECFVIGLHAAMRHPEWAQWALQRLDTFSVESKSMSDTSAIDANLLVDDLPAWMQP